MITIHFFTRQLEKTEKLAKHTNRLSGMMKAKESGYYPALCTQLTTRNPVWSPSVITEWEPQQPTLQTTLLRTLRAQQNIFHPNPMNGRVRLKSKRRSILKIMVTRIEQSKRNGCKRGSMLHPKVLMLKALKQ